MWDVENAGVYARVEIERKDHSRYERLSVQFNDVYKIFLQFISERILKIHPLL